MADVEHNEWLDKMSRAEGHAAPVDSVSLRRRNTMLWGSRLEEVTMDRARGMYEAAPSATPDASTKRKCGTLWKA